jgi:2-keto-4-pentenoate hydratase/2-oxohepta-3-ene-1,7-dioic acid hydratase in catechol pathway
MKWVRFTAGGHTAYGSLSGDTIVEISGEPWGDQQPTGRTHRLPEVKLEVPVIPKTFYCAGINYATHIREMAEKRGVKPVFPEKADIGYRASNALIAHDEDVVIPAHAPPKINYEGELVVVIGKQAKHLTEDEAFSCVFGYTIGNDVSERTWQRGDRTFWRGKNADTFKPMGPWIVTGLDLRDMTTKVTINGRLAHTFPTANMLFSPGEVVSDVSRYNTLSPGDVIWLGTDEVPEAVRPGDLIEIEITGIGVLRNSVVAGT